MVKNKINSEEILSVKEKLFPNEIVYESKYFFVKQDLEIAIPGFYIISPKRKVKSIIEFNKNELLEYIKVMQKIRKAMKDVLNIEEVYYFQNEDTPYGFHLWMLPSYSWMKKVAERGPGLLVPVWKYAKENLGTESNIKKTKESAKRVRNSFLKTKKKKLK